MKAAANGEVQRDSRCILLEVFFCLFYGVFLVAKGMPAATALLGFGLFFYLWLSRLIDLERAG